MPQRTAPPLNAETRGGLLIVDNSRHKQSRTIGKPVMFLVCRHRETQGMQGVTYRKQTFCIFYSTNGCVNVITRLFHLQKPSHSKF